MKGFGEWGNRYKQVLYCVRVRIVRCGLGTGGEN